MRSIRLFPETAAGYPTPPAKRTWTSGSGHGRGETACRLTSGSYHHYQPSLSPDGAMVAYRSETGAPISCGSAAESRNCLPPGPPVLHSHRPPTVSSTFRETGCSLYSAFPGKRPGGSWRAFIRPPPPVRPMVSACWSTVVAKAPPIPVIGGSFLPTAGVLSPRVRPRLARPSPLRKHGSPPGGADHAPG